MLDHQLALPRRRDGFEAQPWYFADIVARVRFIGVAAGAVDGEGNAAVGIRKTLQGEDGTFQKTVVALVLAVIEDCTVGADGYGGVRTG